MALRSATSFSTGGKNAPDEEGKDGAHGHVKAEDLVAQVLAPALVDALDKAIAARERRRKPDAPDAIALDADIVGELADKLDLAAAALAVAEQALVDRCGADPAVGAVGPLWVSSTDDERLVDDRLGADRALVEELRVENLGRAPEDVAVVAEGLALCAVDAAAVVGVPVRRRRVGPGRRALVGRRGEEGRTDEEREPEEPGEEEDRGDDLPSSLDRHELGGAVQLDAVKERAKVREREGWQDRLDVRGRRSPHPQESSSEARPLSLYAKQEGVEALV